MTYLPYIESIRLGGPAQRYRFEASSYGASVVQHKDSYGGNGGLWELAVLFKDTICYCTPITSDVLGWLNDDDVQNTLAEIDALDHECICGVK